jgi:outer membrane protein, heavy metal efflux system
VQAAREVEKGERERFELGDSNLIFVNLREQTAAEAAIREIDALSDYEKAKAAYRAALAMDVEEIKKDLPQCKLNMTN